MSTVRAGLPPGAPLGSEEFTSVVPATRATLFGSSGVLGPSGVEAEVTLVLNLSLWVTTCQCCRERHNAYWATLTDLVDLWTGQPE